MGEFPVRPLVRVPSLYLRYRLGTVSPSTLSRNIRGIRGKTKAEMEEVAEATFARRVKPDIFAGAELLIRRLVTNGAEVVLATLSVDVIVRPLADYLGVREVIAASLEYDEGVCTGRLARGPTFNREKRDYVLDYLSARGVSASACHFYSDSINDLPLLAAVGHPVAVNPDRRLRRVARARNWRVIRFG